MKIKYSPFPQIPAADGMQPTDVSGIHVVVIN